MKNTYFLQDQNIKEDWLINNIISLKFNNFGHVKCHSDWRPEYLVVVAEVDQHRVEYRVFRIPWS